MKTFLTFIIFCLLGYILWTKLSNKASTLRLVAEIEQQQAKIKTLQSGEFATRTAAEQAARDADRAAKQAALDQRDERRIEIDKIYATQKAEIAEQIAVLQASSSAAQDAINVRSRNTPSFSEHRATTYSNGRSAISGVRTSDADRADARKLHEESLKKLTADKAVIDLELARVQARASSLETSYRNARSRLK